ncbi:hypothetical protein CEUSTIGMA_g12352.t1 [Chlamydomonas eustigma]|uniref:Metallo-beta-lactamase domain-containing protein n=1 Tax=Chlamydomonas eustigma TaxID=1157962 RepID=A0A250XPD0_9CHLO|nr:hypothetical protein CEUSTIGMA_g12352.t1 [Chlamydomonas eustigma]|eukprot:GAX84931.1 hypothetical protein CEUSTIGMA_g12352.t1 [Chlamydomonas eustigma]
MLNIDVVILGTGAGATTVYTQECSSSFVLRVDGIPALLADVGFGVVAACKELVGSLPPCIYVSHNHSDHAGELPVLLATDQKHVFAQEQVMQRLKAHRLHELQSTGRPLEAFGFYHSLVEREMFEVPILSPKALGLGTVDGAMQDRVTAFGAEDSHDASYVPQNNASSSSSSSACKLHIKAVKSQNSELCFGLIIYVNQKAVLGWTASSSISTLPMHELMNLIVVLHPCIHN